MLYLMIFLIFLVHFFRTTRWGLTFPGDKPVPGVSSGIECPLNDMLRYALNDMLCYALNDRASFYSVISTK